MSLNLRRFHATITPRDGILVAYIWDGLWIIPPVRLEGATCEDLVTALLDRWIWHWRDAALVALESADGFEVP